jgi:hypothetical protein
LRPSRGRTALERWHARWTNTAWFRCDTCNWRGRLLDVWTPDQAFPDLPALRLGSDLNVDPLQQRDEDALTALILERAESLAGALRVWLDDSRPAPPGWLRVTTVRNARKLIEAGLVREISLDYDLGWCAECLATSEHLKHTGRRHCEHTPTGYDLVQWMADTDHWTLTPPTVHSGNIEGGARMLGLIARHWHDGARVDPPTDAAPAAPQPASQPAPPADIAHEPLAPAPPAGHVSTITNCPKCGGPFLYRTHRHSSFQRLRSLVTRRFPVRCSACGVTFWSRDPILIRLSPPGAPASGNSALDEFDPD